MVMVEEVERLMRDALPAKQDGDAVLYPMPMTYYGGGEVVVFVIKDKEVGDITTIDYLRECGADCDKKFMASVSLKAADYGIKVRGKTLLIKIRDKKKIPAAIISLADFVYKLLEDSANNRIVRTASNYFGEELCDEDVSALGYFMCG